MDTRKLLVADPSPEFCGTLALLLGGAYELRICHDGLEAKAMLQTFSPDVMVIDLALPGLDGLTVLREISGSGSRPAVLVTTRFLSPYIEAAIGALGVDYLMMKPCDMHALADCVRDLTACSVIPAPTAAQVTVSGMLLSLNIPAKRRGFQCLETAVTLFERDPGQSVTKVLYPAVAKLCGGSCASVERAIRGAIWTAWEQRDEKTWRLYFRPCGDGSVPRPTNMAFIACLAECLRRQNRERAL